VDKVKKQGKCRVHSEEHGASPPVPFFDNETAIANASVQSRIPATGELSGKPVADRQQKPGWRVALAERFCRPPG
jgi:hypothetical protein